MKRFSEIGLYILYGIIGGISAEIALIVTVFILVPVTNASMKWMDTDSFGNIIWYEFNPDEAFFRYSFGWLVFCIIIEVTAYWSKQINANLG